MANGKKYKREYDPNMWRELNKRATTVEDSLINQFNEGPSIFGPSKGNIGADLNIVGNTVGTFEATSTALYNYISSGAFDPTDEDHMAFMGELYNKVVLSDPRYNFPMPGDDAGMHPVTEAMLMKDVTSEESTKKLEDFKEHYVTRTALTTKDPGEGGTSTSKPRSESDLGY